VPFAQRYRLIPKTWRGERERGREGGGEGGGEGGREKSELSRTIFSPRARPFSRLSHIREPLRGRRFDFANLPKQSVGAATLHRETDSVSLVYMLNISRPCPLFSDARIDFIGFSTRELFHVARHVSHNIAHVVDHEG